MKRRALLQLILLYWALIKFSVVGLAWCIVASYRYVKATYFVKFKEITL